MENFRLGNYVIELLSIIVGFAVIKWLLRMSDKTKQYADMF